MSVDAPGLALETHLSGLKASGRKLLVIYLTGAFPDIDGCVALMRAATEAGADLIELGIPFSDPVMDGPVIQRASQAALDGGVTPPDVIACVAAADLPVPVALMTYYNSVFRAGPSRFAADAAAAGVGGMIIPDLPLEESAEWEEIAIAAGIAPILLAAPNASDKRLRAVCERSRGFIYAVSLMGVTGARVSLSEHASAISSRLAPLTEKVVALGLGLSTPEQVAEASRMADGVIVGSAVVNLVLDAASTADAVVAVGELVASLRGALDGAR